ncbi:MAG TPA: hypothetical protein VLH38_03050 [Patescibacteria group bacterium]|nr:hypothetical protein [Patescibacteria group bacterium]
MFSSDDVIIERMNNVPTADTDAYFASFKKLLARFREYLPGDIQLDIIRIGDLYPDKQVFEAELAEAMPKFQATFDALDDDTRERRMIMSELNIQPDGVEDLRKLSEDERKARIAHGSVYHDAYCSLSKRRDYIRGEDKIVLFTTRIPNAIAIGTTKTSVTKFWTGMGILEANAGQYKPWVLSPSHLEDADFTWEPVDIGITDNNNLKKIPLLP